MRRSRAVFYTGMLLAFPLFFLLHWNGMFAQAYFWVVVAREGPREFGSHPVEAFVSTVIIFGVVALVFEGVRSLARRRS